MKFHSSKMYGIAIGSIFLAMLWLPSCCDNTIDVGGYAYDAATGQPLDSVQMSLFNSEKRKLDLLLTEPTDSLGRFYFWDSGFCGKEILFVLASKPGYVTQMLEVTSFSPEVVVNMVHE